MALNEEQLTHVIETALENKLGKFFVEREQHYLDHVFVKDVRETTDKIKGTACGVVTKAGMTGIITLLLYGVWYWLTEGKPK